MALSHSGRSDFKRCQRLYYLGRELRLELDTDSSARRMGSAFAIALEHADSRLVYPEMRKAVPAAQWTAQHEMEAAQVELLVELYLVHYQEIPLFQHGKLEREVAFDSKLIGPGRLDGIIQTPHGPVGIEDKLLTKNFWRDADERKLAIDDQVTAYFYAMAELGTPLHELRYRVTFKPTIKQDSRKKETLPQYLERLKEKLAEDSPFREYRQFRSPDQLEEFRLEVLDIERQRKAAKRSGIWPKNTGACTMYGECAFLSMCRREPGAEQKYRKRPERPRLSEAQVQVLKALADSFTGSATVPDIARQAMRDARGVGPALGALQRKGLVTRYDDANWCITTEGFAASDLY